MYRLLKQGTAMIMSAYTTEAGVVEAVGAGLFYDSDHVITAAHVILNIKGSNYSLVDRVLVVYNTQVIDATVVGISPIADVAVLKLSNKVDVVPLSWSTKGAKAKQTVFTLGPLLDSDVLALSTGVIRNPRMRYLQDCNIISLLDVDMAIGGGISGSPIVDSQGHIVGMVSFTLNWLPSQGVNYLISTGTTCGPRSETVHYIVKQIIDGIDVQERQGYRLWLGKSIGVDGNYILPYSQAPATTMSVRQLDQYSQLSPYGAVIKSGLNDYLYPGNVITSINGIPVYKETIGDIVYRLNYGDQVVVRAVFPGGRGDLPAIVQPLGSLNKVITGVEVLLTSTNISNTIASLVSTIGKDLLKLLGLIKTIIVNTVELVEGVLEIEDFLSFVDVLLLFVEVLNDIADLADLLHTLMGHIETLVTDIREYSVKYTPPSKEPSPPNSAIFGQYSGSIFLKSLTVSGKYTNGIGGDYNSSRSYLLPIKWLDVQNGGIVFLYPGYYYLKTAVIGIGPAGSKLPLRSTSFSFGSFSYSSHEALILKQLITITDGLTNQTMNIKISASANSASMLYLIITPTIIMGKPFEINKSITLPLIHAGYSYNGLNLLYLTKPDIGPLDTLLFSTSPSGTLMVIGDSVLTVNISSSSLTKVNIYQIVGNKAISISSGSATSNSYQATLKVNASANNGAIPIFFTADATDVTVIVTSVYKSFSALKTINDNYFPSSTPQKNDPGLSNNTATAITDIQSIQANSSGTGYDVVRNRVPAGSRQYIDPYNPTQVTAKVGNTTPLFYIYKITPEVDVNGTYQPDGYYDVQAPQYLVGFFDDNTIFITQAGSYNVRISNVAKHNDGAFATLTAQVVGGGTIWTSRKFFSSNGPVNFGFTLYVYEPGIMPTNPNTPYVLTNQPFYFICSRPVVMDSVTLTIGNEYTPKFPWKFINIKNKEVAKTQVYVPPSRPQLFYDNIQGIIQTWDKSTTATVFQNAISSYDKTSGKDSQAYTNTVQNKLPFYLPLTLTDFFNYINGKAPSSTYTTPDGKSYEQDAIALKTDLLATATTLGVEKWLVEYMTGTLPISLTGAQSAQSILSMTHSTFSNTYIQHSSNGTPTGGLWYEHPNQVIAIVALLFSYSKDAYYDFVTNTIVDGKPTGPAITAYLTALKFPNLSRYDTASFLLIIARTTSLANYLTIWINEGVLPYYLTIMALDGKDNYRTFVDELYGSNSGSQFAAWVKKPPHFG